MPIADDWTIDYVDKKIYHQEFVASLAIAEVSTVTVVTAESGGNYNGKNFLLNSASDSSKYYIWFQVAGVGTDPVPAGRIGILVTLVAADATATIATKIAAQINLASSIQTTDFTATAPASVVTITNAKKGATTDIADGLTAPLGALATLAVTTQGNFGEAITEVNDVTVPAAGLITGGDYFNLYSATDATNYAVWYFKASVGTAPTGKTGIQVTIGASDTAATVATQTRTAINTAPQSADFTASDPGATSAIVRITNKAAGSTTNPTSANVNFTFVVRRIGRGKTVWSVNALYSLLQDEFDELGNMDDAIPISAQTPTDYTLINGWFIDEVSIKYLKGGAIKTSGWNGQIQQLKLAGVYTAIVAADIGKQVRAAAVNVGALLFADNSATRQRWWFRSTSTVADASAMTINTGTGAGTASGASVSGENLYANIFTLGGIETVPKPTTYIFQSGSSIDGWWGRGDATAHIDVLIRVREAGTMISSGIITVFIRQYGDLYDNFEIDLTAGGRNAVPLASQKDTANNTLGEAYLLYKGKTAAFTAGKILSQGTSVSAEIIAVQDDGATGYLTLGNVIGTFADNVAITDDGTGAAVANGTIGDTILNYNAKTVGFTSLGQIVTGATSTAKRALRGAQDDGLTGRLNLQVSNTADPTHFKVYSNAELVTGATNGSASANGASVTNASGFADVKIWFMNVEVGFMSKTGLINEGDLVTGATSGATAIFLAEKNSTTLQLANWNGTSFTAGEQLRKDVTNYYVLATPTSQTANHLRNKAFQLQAANPYSVIVDCAGRKVAQAYEWLKYVTREKANISQINRQIMYPLISGVVNKQNGEAYIGARVSPDTAYVQSKTSPLGTFSGGKLFGAQGVWIQNTHTDDIQAFQVIDANGTIQNPPNFQVVKVSGVVSGDRVTVLRTTGTNVVNKAVFTAASGNLITNTTFVVNEAIPADTPSSGIIRIVNIADTTNTRERRYSYTSWATSTFSGITKTFAPLTAGLDRTYTATSDTAYVSFIDTEATTIEVSQTIIYTANRTVVTWVRKYLGTSTIIPFETTGTLTSSGYQTTAIRTTDPIAT